MATRGKLYVFEGPDGAGKSTLANGLSRYLNSTGVTCELLAFPGNEQGTLGALVYRLHHFKDEFGIQRIDSGSLQILHVAAHVDAIVNRIVPLLREGVTVVLDRYWWSTWVYGAYSLVSKSTLNALVNVELQYWNNYLPTQVFLIDRDVSLRSDVSMIEWDELRNLYLELRSAEEAKYPVKVIRNETAVEDALSAIIELMSTGMTKKKAPGLGV